MASAISLWGQPLPSNLPFIKGTDVAVAITTTPVPGTFRYSYRVANSTSSLGELSTFCLDISTSPGSIPLDSAGLLNAASGYAETASANARNRAGSSMVPIGVESNPRGWTSGISTFATMCWFGPIPAQLESAPGHSLTGFAIASRGLPGIRMFSARPIFDDDAFFPATEDMTEDQLIALNQQANAAVQAIKFTGTTIAPEAPQSFAPASLIGRIASLQRRASELAWIGDAKFVRKLSRRLDEAQLALASDKKKLARVRLTQFVHDLTEVHEEQGEAGHEHDKDNDEHRREKFVNDEAFQLLKINADFIIAKLPAKAKDRDEDDECRRAESEKGDDRPGGKGRGR